MHVTLGAIGLGCKHAASSFTIHAQIKNIHKTFNIILHHGSNFVEHREKTSLCMAQTLWETGANISLHELKFCETPSACMRSNFVGHRKKTSLCMSSNFVGDQRKRLSDLVHIFIFSSTTLCILLAWDGFIVLIKGSQVKNFQVMMQLTFFSFKSPKIFFAHIYIANSADPDECHILWHFIWVFTICQFSTCSWVPVYKGLVYHSLKLIAIGKSKSLEAA